jgi:hypothetical protein
MFLIRKVHSFQVLTKGILPFIKFFFIIGFIEVTGISINRHLPRYISNFTVHGLTGILSHEIQTLQTKVVVELEGILVEVLIIAGRTLGESEEDGLALMAWFLLHASRLHLLIDLEEVSRYSWLSNKNSCPIWKQRCSDLLALGISGIIDRLEDRQGVDQFLAVANYVIGKNNKHPIVAFWILKIQGDLFVWMVVIFEAKMAGAIRSIQFNRKKDTILHWNLRELIEPGVRLGVLRLGV